MTLIELVRIECDICGTRCPGIQADRDTMLDLAERYGWKVWRTPDRGAYGKALCNQCREPAIADGSCTIQVEHYSHSWVVGKKTYSCSGKRATR
jgi:hypothetical protein